MIERIDFTKAPLSIAIAMQFDGPQPNHFGAEVATAKPMRSGSFIGDTRQGGSCNAEQITFNPHCNGTHTESISHLINDLIAPHQVIKQPLMPAYLLSLLPRLYGDVSADADSYQPPAVPQDLMICKDMLTAVKNNIQSGVKALIIRCLPNHKSKLDQVYGGPQQPPFFSNQAMQWLVEHTDVEHLLVDMPSVDRLQDDGLLSNHRIFWNIEPGSHLSTEHQHQHKTITEMIYVPNDIKDGHYILNLQLPRLNLNAVPSNPLLYQLKQ